MTGTLLAVAVTAAGCNNPYGPATWDATPDTVTLYSLSRADLLGQPSGFDFINLAPVVVESPGATGSWDAALAESNGGFVMLPSSAFTGVASRAGIAILTNASFDAVTEAPKDTLAFQQQAVPLQVGGVYVLRTRSDVCPDLLSTGVRYAKMEVLDLDETGGTARFMVVRNPYCSDRSFTPPS